MTVGPIQTYTPQTPEQIAQQRAWFDERTRQQAWIDQYNAANPFTTNYLQQQQQLYNQQYADWEQNNPVPEQTQWDYWTEQVPIRQQVYKEAEAALRQAEGKHRRFSRDHPLSKAAHKALWDLNQAYNSRRYWWKTDPSTTPERAAAPTPLSTSVYGGPTKLKPWYGDEDPDSRWNAPDWEKFGTLAFDEGVGARSGHFGSYPGLSLDPVHGRSAMPIGWNTPWYPHVRKPGVKYSQPWNPNLPDFQINYHTKYRQPDSGWNTTVVGKVHDPVMDEWYKHQWDAQQAFWEQFKERGGRVTGKTFLPGGGSFSDPSAKATSGPRSPFDFGAREWERRHREIEREREWGDKWRDEHPDWGDQKIPPPRVGFNDPRTPTGTWTSSLTRPSNPNEWEGPVVTPGVNSSLEPGDTNFGGATGDPVVANENVIRNSNKPRPISQTFK